jgi:hypothetical protein
MRLKATNMTDTVKKTLAQQIFKKIKKQIFKQEL